MVAHRAPGEAKDAFASRAKPGRAARVGERRRHATTTVRDGAPGAERARRVEQ